MITVWVTQLLNWSAQLLNWSVWLVDTTGYYGVLLLMLIESTVFPFPSELVLPQAGYLAQQGKMNALLAVFVGTLGSCLGALINYAFALYVGRPFLLRYGHYFFCPREKFEKAEMFFRQHGEIGTFTGRLIPGVRHLISLPAGVSRMKLRHFLGFTALGAGMWCGILVALGYWVGAERERIAPYYHSIVLGMLALCIALIGGYILWHRGRRNDGRWNKG